MNQKTEPNTIEKSYTAMGNLLNLSLNTDIEVYLDSVITQAKDAIGAEFGILTLKVNTIDGEKTHHHETGVIPESFYSKNLITNGISVSIIVDDQELGVLILGSDNVNFTDLDHSCTMMFAKFAARIAEHERFVQDSNAKSYWLDSAADIVALIGRSGGDENAWSMACDLLAEISRCKTVKWLPPNNDHHQAELVENKDETIVCIPLRVDGVGGEKSWRGGTLVFCWPANAYPGPKIMPSSERIGERMGTSWMLARAQQDRATLAVYEDRDRIARDLHDLVIQRLFAAGLSIEATLPTLPAATGIRMSQIIDDLDDTIGDLRATIFSLSNSDIAITLRSKIKKIIDQAKDMLGFSPKLNLVGSYWLIPDNIARDVLLVIREALSNTARHAGATAVSVTLQVGKEIVIDVIDNGCGLNPDNHRRSGLANLLNRAKSSGGYLNLQTPTNQTGTWLQWYAPLP